MGGCSSAVAEEPLLGNPEALLQQAHETDFPEHGKKMRTDVSFKEAYELGQPLGWGGFSKVKLVTSRETGERYACKIIPLPRPGHASNEHQCTRTAILQEVDALLELDHPNVVGLKEYFVWAGRLCLVMELLPGGELLDLVLEKGPFSEDDARTVFRQLLEGVDYLHRMGVTHRDLKLDNLLLARPGDISAIRIVDFGFAKKHHAADRLNNPMKTVCGTPEYMAPEVIRRPKRQRLRGCCNWQQLAAGLCGTGSPTPGPASTSRPPAAPGGAGGSTGAAYGPACDCWSCGIILYLLLSGGEPPFSDPSQPRLLRTIVAGKFSFGAAVWKGVSKEAKDLICRLLVVDPDERWDCRRALGHPWMRRQPSSPTGGSSRSRGVSSGGIKMPLIAPAPPAQHQGSTLAAAGAPATPPAYGGKGLAR
ncbi:hypothetical protein ABPG75_007072 [Micractinium tetrahymenae]